MLALIMPMCFSDYYSLEQIRLARTHGQSKENMRGSGPKYINVLTTKLTTTVDIGEVKVDGNIVEVVMSFIFLGALITRDGLCDKEIRRRITMSKSAVGGLTIIWKDGGIKLPTKVKLVKAMVFPIVLYGTTTREAGRMKIDAFEMRCLRRVEYVVDGE